MFFFYSFYFFPQQELMQVIKKRECLEVIRWQECLVCVDRHPSRAGMKVRRSDWRDGRNKGAGFWWRWMPAEERKTIFQLSPWVSLTITTWEMLPLSLPPLPLVLSFISLFDTFVLSFNLPYPPNHSPPRCLFGDVPFSLHLSYMAKPLVSAAGRRG